MDFSLTYDITQIALSVSIFNSHFHSPQYQFQNHIVCFKPIILSACPLISSVPALLSFFALCNTLRGVTLLFMSSLNFLLFPLLYRKLLEHKRLKIKIYYSSKFCQLLGLSWIALSCNFS